MKFLAILFAFVVSQGAIAGDVPTGTWTGSTVVKELVGSPIHGSVKYRISKNRFFVEYDFGSGPTNSWEWNLRWASSTSDAFQIYRRGDFRGHGFCTNNRRCYFEGVVAGRKLKFNFLKTGRNTALVFGFSETANGDIHLHWEENLRRR